MSYTDKVHISWDKIIADCEKLASQIKASGDYPKKILAITRGGLFPASIVTRYLGIKDIETIGLESYHGQSQNNDIKTLKDAKAEYLQNALIIDDLVDTGKTLEYLKGIATNCRFAVLYTKPKGKPFTDFSVEDYAQEEWIAFPWEAIPDEE